MLLPLFLIFLSNWRPVFCFCSAPSRLYSSFLPPMLNPTEAQQTSLPYFPSGSCLYGVKCKMNSIHQPNNKPTESVSPPIRLSNQPNSRNDYSFLVDAVQSTARYLNTCFLAVSVGYSQRFISYQIVVPRLLCFLGYRSDCLLTSAWTIHNGSWLHPKALNPPT